MSKKTLTLNDLEKEKIKIDKDIAIYEALLELEKKLNNILGLDKKSNEVKN